MTAKNLLLCFDAFGTLFKPRYSIAKQYGDVARALGHSGFSDDDISSSFTTAYKHESKQNPNFGKANGLNAEKWWGNIIRKTFEPVLGPDQPLHRDLVPRLLHRFWCDEGYTLFPDVLPLLNRLRAAHEATNTRVVVGVITNSDERVPDILTSLGMRVNSLRYGTEMDDTLIGERPFDIDFSVMSYDVGVEKPDRQMFLAAEQMLQRIIKTASPIEPAEFDPHQWRKVYIGDEYAKDVVGALSAEWNAILVERDQTKRRDDILLLEGEPASNLYNVFETTRAVQFSSLERLAQWLPSN